MSISRINAPDAECPAASLANAAVSSVSGAGTLRVRACIDWLRDYAATRLNSRLMDERRAMSPHVVLDFGNRGLLGMQVPLHYGGKLELSTYEMLQVGRQLGAIDLSLAFFCGGNNQLGVRPVWKSASETLKQRLLPDMASGRMLGALAITEPLAGSNPLGIRASARACDGGFVLNAHKIWSGTAAWAGVVNVVFNQQGADGRETGHVAFCVPTEQPGLRVGAEALTTGLRSMVQSAVLLQDVKLSADCMLGAPGAGLLVANESMAAARLGIAAACVGGMWRALQLAARYAGRRSIGGRLLSDSELIKTRLASMHAAAQAADALVDRLAQDLDCGVVVPGDAFAAVKALASEWLGQVVDAATQTLGGRGYIETNVLPQMTRDARLTRIFEGPTDTLLIYVGQRLDGSNPPLLAYLSRLGADTTTLRELVAVARGGGGSAGQAQIGLLGSLHLARACARDSVSLAWLDVQIERAAAEFRRAPMAGASADELQRQMTERIGDIEQAAADEDRSLDAYLRKEFVA